MRDPRRTRLVQTMTHPIAARISARRDWRSPVRRMTPGSRIAETNGRRCSHHCSIDRRRPRRTRSGSGARITAGTENSVTCRHSLFGVHGRDGSPGWVCRSRPPGEVEEFSRRAASVRRHRTVCSTGRSTVRNTLLRNIHEPHSGSRRSSWFTRNRKRLRGPAAVRPRTSSPLAVCQFAACSCLANHQAGKHRVEWAHTSRNARSWFTTQFAHDARPMKFPERSRNSHPARSTTAHGRSSR